MEAGGGRGKQVEAGGGRVGRGKQGEAGGGRIERGLQQEITHDLPDVIHTFIAPHFMCQVVLLGSAPDPKIQKQFEDAAAEADRWGGDATTTTLFEYIA